MQKKPDLRPRKRYGQHFLHDKNVINRIIDAINPEPDIPIVEIGPGLGALTYPLLATVNTLDVIEIDRDLAVKLVSGNPGPGRLVMHQGDALAFDYCSLYSNKIKLVGNLPYNISTPLLFHLLDQSGCIEEMLFMMQKEVIDRICAGPGTHDYGRLSVMIQSQCHVECLFTVSNNAFSPPPKVESAVIRISLPSRPKIAITDKILFNKIVKTAFNFRRKTLRNALKGLIDEDTFTALGIPATSRAENLSIEQFAILANRLHEQAGD